MAPTTSVAVVVVDIMLLIECLFCVVWVYVVLHAVMAACFFPDKKLHANF